MTITHAAIARAARSALRLAQAGIWSALFAAGTFLAASPACAQNTGAIKGVVKDKQHAVIKGANLTLTSATDKTLRSASSDEQGEYAFRNLAAGAYTLTVSAKGFQTSEPITLSVSAGAAERDIVLQVQSVSESVTVTAENESALMRSPVNGSNTTTEITRAGLERLGGAGISPYKALSTLPSVNVELADAYGLTNGGQSIRSRGQNYIGSTVEGMSLMNQGLDPGPADRWLLDMDNLSALTMSMGGVSADLSLNAYNAGGSMDRKMLWAQDKISGKLNTQFGSFNYKRVFGRFDSGMLPSKTALFGSYSYTAADKWRGLGDSQINIVTLGVDQQISRWKIHAAGSYSRPRTHPYATLNWTQANNLGLDSNYYYDYNRTLIPGNTANNLKYFDYNRDSFTSVALFGVAQADFGKQGVLTLKPYYVREHGYTLSTSGSNGIQKWIIEHYNYSVTAQYERHYKNFDFGAGYWFSIQEPPGPPTTQKLYTFNTDGSLKFSKWSTLAQVTTNHHWNTPYITAAWHDGPWRVNGQLRYVYERLPSFTLYDASSVTVDTDANTAYGLAKVNPNGSAYGVLMRAWLPTLNISYAVTPQINAYVNYGRNFGRAAFGNWTSYNTNAARFIAAGLTEQYLWSQLRPEISDNIDLGVNYNGHGWHASLVGYDMISTHRGVTIADPILLLNVTQNTARAVARGADVKISKELGQWFNIFGTASRDKFYFTNNLTSLVAPASPATKIVLAKGHQVPDVPGYMASAGATAKYKGFELSPLARYMGSRYADVLNVYRIPSYATMDLDLRYKRSFDAASRHSVEAGLSFSNLFNRRYIAIMSSSDDTQDGSAASFTPGSPRAVVGNVQLHF